MLNTDYTSDYISQVAQRKLTRTQTRNRKLTLCGLRKSKNKVLNDCTDVFRRVNAEGLAHDQMFCICDVWLDRSSAVLTSVIKNRYGKV